MYIDQVRDVFSSFNPSDADPLIGPFTSSMHKDSLMKNYMVQIDETRHYGRVMLKIPPLDFWSLRRNTRFLKCAKEKSSKALRTWVFLERLT